MAASLDQLTKPLTVAECKKAIYDVLAAVGVSTTGWFSGAVIRTMIAAVAIVLAAFSRLQANIAKMGFLELAEGLWLTLVARYVYGVERIEATFATGEVTLTNTGGGEYPFGVDDLVFLNPTTKKTYRNISPGTVHALETLTIAVRAVEAGSASIATPGTITQMETPLPGVTCTNAASVIGRDDELDPDLRLRCSEKLGALSPNGPADAYAFVARNAKFVDGASVGVTRLRVVRDGFGNVYVYCATDAGVLSGTVGDLTTPLGIVDEAIQTQTVPLSVTGHVASATPVAIPVIYQAWVYDTVGISVDDFATKAAQKLALFMAAQPVGGNVIGFALGKVYDEGIKGAILDAGKVGTDPKQSEVFRVELITPSGDTSLQANEVPVLGGITASVFLVSKKGLS
jgi:hypothetical protein